MVQSKSDRERQKLITDKCQSLIEVLLKDEDNKYCVDCDAKGPRWASWNLGIFLCIRCAGIHRNLGVHISRVKSVNLDAWTPEHVAYVQRMGNSRARAIYEANLPDDFRRPQTDTALESFIRAKYEHKKYLAQDYVDPGPPEPAFNVDEEIKRIKEQKRSKLSGGSNKPMLSVSSELSSTPNSKPRPTIQQNQQPSQENVVTSSTNIKTEKANSSALADLIDLDLGFGAPAQPSNYSNNNISLKSNNDSAITSSTSANLASLADLMSPPPTSSNLFNQMSTPMSQATSTSKNPIFSNISSSSTTSTSSPVMSPFDSFGTAFPSTLTPMTTSTNLTPTMATQTTAETKANDLTSTSRKNVLDLLDL